MHFLLKVFLALLAIQIALALPFDVQYDQTTGLSSQNTANKARIDAAATLANTQVRNMRQALTNIKNGGEAGKKAKKLFDASFGKNADMNVVDNTVTQLENGVVKVQVATHRFTDGEFAAVKWTHRGKPKRWTAGRVRFGPKFHGHELDDHGRAGTLIHEATHQLSKTGDLVNERGNIIRPYDQISKEVGTDGYTTNPNMHKTISQVNADKKYKKVRNNANNMHMNAESYAVFASLCSRPGALRRRDVRLYDRALLESDDDQLRYLARRNSCQLPPKHGIKATAPIQVANSGHFAKGLNTRKGSKSLLKGHRQTTKSNAKPTVNGVGTLATQGATAAFNKYRARGFKLPLTLSSANAAPKVVNEPASKAQAFAHFHKRIPAQAPVVAKGNKH